MLPWGTPGDVLLNEFAQGCARCQTTLGRLLPPGASGSLLRADSFFDGTSAGGPALILAAWVALGLALLLIADRRGSRASRAGAPARPAEPAAA